MVRRQDEGAGRQALADDIKLEITMGVCLVDLARHLVLNSAGKTHGAVAQQVCSDGDRRHCACRRGRLWRIVPESGMTEGSAVSGRKVWWATRGRTQCQRQGKAVRGQSQISMSCRRRGQVLSACTAEALKVVVSATCEAGGQSEISKSCPRGFVQSRTDGASRQGTVDPHDVQPRGGGRAGGEVQGPAQVRLVPHDLTGEAAVSMTLELRPSGVQGRLTTTRGQQCGHGFGGRPR